MGRPLRYTVQERIDKLFSLKIARDGGVIKRLKHHVLRYIPLDDLKAEVQKRDYHLAIIGDYIVIFCFPGALMLLA